MFSDLQEYGAHPSKDVKILCTPVHNKQITMYNRTEWMEYYVQVYRGDKILCTPVQKKDEPTKHARMGRGNILILEILHIIYISSLNFMTLLIPAPSRLTSVTRVTMKSERP